MKQLLISFQLLLSTQLWSTSILTVPNIDFAKRSYEIERIGYQNINRIVEILYKYDVILTANAVLVEIKKKY